MNDLEALLVLATIPQLGSIKIRMLLNHFGSALDALHSSKKELSEVSCLGPKTIETWENWKKDSSWKENLKLVEKYHVDVIPFTSEKYPQRLLKIHDHPTFLYVKGEIKKSDQQCIAIVGTRQASIYGKEMAHRIAQELTNEGFTIVSGLARGIDTAAHVGAIKNGRTFAVIGSGLADIYPRENGLLADQISQQGALISEFPMAAPPDRQNFPQRNRIVSGMALGTILIEGPVKSGAMLTMEKTFSQGRTLFALPGRVDYENFGGNHQLIKTGKAQLIENARDVIEYFSDLFNPTKQYCIKANKPLLDEEEEQLLKVLPKFETTIEEILTITKLPVAKLNVLLMGLILKKIIKEFPGKIYKVI